jgi:hypothetical protein
MFKMKSFFSERICYIQEKLKYLLPENGSHNSLLLSGHLNPNIIYLQIPLALFPSPTSSTCLQARPGVPGASSDIDLGFVEELSEHGFHLILLGLDLQELEKAKAQIGVTSPGTKVEIFAADTSNVSVLGVEGIVKVMGTFTSRS